MRVVIVNVDIETVKQGRKNYQIANVQYTFKGEARTKKIMSFANPEVFKKVQTLVGEEVEVHTGKNANGYDEWTHISNGEAASATTYAPSTSTPKALPTRPASNFEERDEKRQLYIIRQSSLERAVQVLPESLPAEDYTRLADKFVDWVLGKNEEKSIFDMEDDFPA